MGAFQVCEAIHGWYQGHSPVIAIADRVLQLIFSYCWACACFGFLRDAIVVDLHFALLPIWILRFPRVAPHSNLSHWYIYIYMQWGFEWTYLTAIAVGFQMEILFYIDGLFLCFRKLIANSSVFVPCKRILPIQTWLTDIYTYIYIYIYIYAVGFGWTYLTAIAVGFWMEILVRDRRSVFMRWSRSIGIVVILESLVTLIIRCRCSLTVK